MTTPTQGRHWGKYGWEGSASPEEVLQLQRQQVALQRQQLAVQRRRLTQGAEDKKYRDTLRFDGGLLIVAIFFPGAWLVAIPWAYACLWKPRVPVAVSLIVTALLIGVIEAVTPFPGWRETELIIGVVLVGFGFFSHYVGWTQPAAS